jgi:N6-adenosine-specific RNA methylase IME4
MTDFPAGPFDVILADPPWSYYGDPRKDQAAGKHYPCLTAAELAALPVRGLAARGAVLFCWATGPKLAEAVDLLRSWRFHVRGVAFVWVKTTKDGRVIGGQGIRPSVTKPTTEFVLWGATAARGRPLPVCDEAMPQVVLAPRPTRPGGGVWHSAKPPAVRANIEALYGPGVRRVELFARERAAGWTGWGGGLRGTS